ncbi:MAG: sulfatase-like hydrolase/transferase [Thermoguttaceae bacterium]
MKNTHPVHAAILCVCAAGLVRTPIAATGATETPQAVPRPNVVFFLADDQRFDELSCTRDSIVKTPNIDRMAREGVLFENSFVTSASCMPNRTSLLTGQWERRHTVGWNSGSALSRRQWADTFPMQLRQIGYVVAYLGKNHTPGLRAWDFDYYYGNRLGHLGFYPKPAQPIFGNALADTQIEILGEGAANFLETDAQFLERAGEKAGVFLRKRPEGKPFFLYVCFNVPHGAGTGSMQQRPTDDALYQTAYRDLAGTIPPPPGYIAAADLKEPKIPTAVYSGRQIAQYDYRLTLPSRQEQRVRICQTVSGIDRVVGQIREQLQKLGLAENTIVIYSADNGILHGEHGYGGKCLLYDPSIRVPLVVCDPRRPAGLRGRRLEELVLSEDVGPTILELCGVSPPASMQGRSLRPLLDGEPVRWRRDFFCESLILLQEYPLIQGVRSREWKYIRYWPNRPTPTDYRELLNTGLRGEPPAYEELFRLVDDPLEQRNLAAEPEHQGQLAAMRVRCVKLLREARGDPATLPTISPAEWMGEVPAEWKEVVPLLSASSAGQAASGEDRPGRKKPRAPSAP